MFNFEQLSGQPFLIKEGSTLNVNIISTETISFENKRKSSVQDTINEGNFFQFVSKGDTRFALNFYFATLNDWEEFLDFINDSPTLLLASSFFDISTPLKVLGDATLDSYYTGFGTSKITFTTAVDGTDSESLLRFGIGAVSDALNKQTSGDKTTFLDKLRTFTNNVNDAVSKTNEFVGGFTNIASQYVGALSNLVNSIAAGGTIVTNPINSVKASADQITGAINNAITDILSAVDAVKSVPDDVSAIANAFSIIGDRLNNLFSSGNTASDSAKYNTEFLFEVSDSFLNIVVEPVNRDAEVNEDQSPENYQRAEFFLSTAVSSVKESISICAISSILINIYENIDTIDRWNQTDLDSLLKRTEALYSYLIGFELSSEFKLQLDLARNRFFSLFKEVYKDALKTITVKVKEPTNLSTIVYAVNGNLDYYDQTKKLNNVLGGVVYSDVEVIYNG